MRAYTPVLPYAMLLLAAACAGAERDPGQTLARMREIVRDEAANLPNYTCVQTIDRVFLRPSNDKLPQSCAAVGDLKRLGRYSLAPARADRFRLDVRIGGGKEMFSWVGASRFEDRPLHDLIGFGPTSTGSFGGLLLAVFEDAPEFRYEGAKTANGRRGYAYSFRVPVERSHHTFYVRHGSQKIIAYEGTVLADPETGTPAQLTVVADQLPADAACCRFALELNYRHMRIGSREFLLPFEAIQRFAAPGGEEVENTVTFSSCRAYGAESIVAYEGAPVTEGAATAAPIAPHPPEAPAGLPVSIALAGAIDSAVAAAGDPFTGRLARPVLDKSRNVIAPEGALVRGRIMQVERVMRPERVTFRLGIETVEIGGVEVPFRLAAKNEPAAPKGASGGLQQRGVAIGEFPRWVPGNHITVQCSGNRCVLPIGFRTEWVTPWRP